MKISATLLALAATFGSFTMAAPVIGKRGVTVVTVTSEVVDVINYTTTLYVDSMPVTSDVTTTSSSSYTPTTTNSTTSSSSTPSSTTVSTTVSTTSSSSSTSTTLSTSTKPSSTSTIPSSTSTSTTTPAPTTSSSSKSTSTPPPATSSAAPSTTSTSTPPPAPTTTSAPPPPSSSASVAPAATSSAAPSSASTGSSSGSSGSYQGEITYYDPAVAPGSCGSVIDGTVDKIVALPIAMFDAANVDGNPNHNPLCGKTITVQVGSKSVVATVTDACQGCSGYHIDLSSCAFDALAAEAAGVVPATWWFN